MQYHATPKGDEIYDRIKYNEISCNRIRQLTIHFRPKQSIVGHRKGNFGQPVEQPNGHLMENRRYPPSDSNSPELQDAGKKFYFTLDIIFLDSQLQPRCSTDAKLIYFASVSGCRYLQQEVYTGQSCTAFRCTGSKGVTVHCSPVNIQ